MRWLGTSTAVLSLIAVCVPANVHGQPDASARESAASEEPADARDLELPAGERPDVHADIVPKTVIVGEPIKLTITATANEGDDVGFPQQSLAPFEVHAKRSRQQSLSDTRRRFIFELDLLALTPGPSTVPPVALRVVTQRGQIGTVKTAPLPVQIKSILANEPNAKPKPARAPVTVTQDDYTLLWVGGALLVALILALLGFLIARWYQRRPRAALPMTPPRPPWELALDELARLRSARPDLASAQDSVAWVDAVSDVLRDYLGKRFGFEGLESTTDEVLHNLEQADLQETVAIEIAAVLQQGDLIKFAKAALDAETCTQMIEAAVHVVNATIPTLATSDQGGALAEPPAQGVSP
jgi:hypothetical protein